MGTGAAWMAAWWLSTTAWAGEAAVTPRPLLGGTPPVAHQQVVVEAEVIDARRHGERWVVAARTGSAIVEVVAPVVDAPERLVPGARITAEGRFVGFPTVADRPWGVVTADRMAVTSDPPFVTPMRALGAIAALWFLVLLGLLAATLERRALLQALRDRRPPRVPPPPAPAEPPLTAAELYRPLTVVGLGGAALLDRSHDPVAAAVAQELLGAVRALRQRLADLPSTGEATLSAGAIDLDEVVQEAVERAQPLLSARSLKLELQLTPTDAIGATEVIEAVVADLLDLVARSARDGDALLVQVWHDGGFAYLRIRDQGASVPPELRQAAVGSTLPGHNRAPATPRVRLAGAALQAIGGDIVVEDVPLGASLLVYLTVPPDQETDPPVPR